MNVLTYDTEEFLSMKKPGREAPAVTDIREATTPKADTTPACLAPNQLAATLLGVLRIKMLPIAPKQEPMMHQVGSPTSRRALSHAPPVTRTAPIRRQMPVPTLAMRKLQGKANNG